MGGWVDALLIYLKGWEGGVAAEEELARGGGGGGGGGRREVVGGWLAGDEAGDGVAFGRGEEVPEPDVVVA